MREACERRHPWTRTVSPGHDALVALGLLLLTVATACGSIGGPPPTPVVIVVTATPGPPTPAPAATPTAVAASKPGATPTAVAASKPTVAEKRVTPSPTAAPAPQSLNIGRTNSYRGLLFTVEEARSGQTIERESAPRGKTLVGLRMKVHNPNGQVVHFGNTALGQLARLRLPDGATVAPGSHDPLYRPRLEPQETLTGWFYFELDRSVPLEPLALALGGGQETVVTIPFSGPEPKIAKRTFEYLRSTEPVRGLIWSVSGGEIRLDLPGQQANPGQEFIIVNVRATNPSPTVVFVRGPRSVPQDGTEYLRIRADNGVLLQVSAELSALPSEFPPKAEQDTQYAWQLPLGSKNPALAILSPDGSQHFLELGPFPPP
jgi:hypothetical protein